jgi:branched-chain amino acid transport system substrate-binding protein
VEVRTSKRSPIVATLVASLFAALAPPLAAQAPAGSTWIGSSIPLTGTVASFGQRSRWGAQTAIAEVNARGGVPGRKVEIDV